MRYVVLRDDDTNALTPVECLERLYRPFLDRGLPVNLAVIPEVSTGVTLANGRPEGFLWNLAKPTPGMVPIGGNAALTSYLLENPGFHVAQHGLHHDYFEFDSHDRREIQRRLDRGTELLVEAGFSRPQTFVAPYDKFSRVSLAEAAKRFAVLSSGWYELRRLPVSWWPKYLRKKCFGAAHWQRKRTLLLSHPGCLLSHRRPRKGMLDAVMKAVRHNPLTVLVTHWWEYFPDSRPDEEFIGLLHATAARLHEDPTVSVIPFGALARGETKGWL